MFRLQLSLNKEKLRVSAFLSFSKDRLRKINHIKPEEKKKKSLLPICYCPYVFEIDKKKEKKTEMTDMMDMNKLKANIPQSCCSDKDILRIAASVPSALVLFTGVSRSF